VNDGELAQLRSRTIWQTLLGIAKRTPQRHALVAANDAGEVQRVTYERLLERVRDVSAGLASIGVRRGDRLVLWMTNTPILAAGYGTGAPHFSRVAGSR
jgi:fatty-acyl-CoA synthase